MVTYEATTQYPALYTSQESLSSIPSRAATLRLSEQPTSVNIGNSEAVTYKPSLLFTSTESFTSSQAEATSLQSTERSTAFNSWSSEAATRPPSTLYTQTESSAYSQTDKNTLSTIEQTFTVDKATSSPPLSCTTGSTASLPLDISEINSDPCQSVTSDACDNMTEMVPEYCECDADGIWTIIQKRFDGSVDFYRSWMDYKEGFGCLNGEYWLGNDLIHLMTSNSSYTLKVVLTDWENVTKYAQYDTFRIADEADGYRLTIGGYSGDAGDSLISYHNGFMFSTKDRDTGPLAYKKCAQFYSGAWWYRSCFVSNLNGRYYFPPDGHLPDGIIWWSWRHKNYSLKATKLMIKPN